MTTVQKRQIDRLQRIAGFGSRHAGDFEAESRGPFFFAQLVDALNTLKGSGKTGGASEALSGKAAKRAELKKLLAAMAQTARLLEKENPYFKGKFQLPDQRSKGGLIEAGHWFLLDATSVEQDFVDFEMPADFLQELKSLLAEYESSQEEAPVTPKPRGGRRQASGQTQQIESLLQCLDVIVTNKYRGQFDVLAEWKEGLDTKRKTRRKKTAAQ